MTLPAYSYPHGVTSSKAKPIHTYTENGVYNGVYSVSLTITDSAAEDGNLGGATLQWSVTLHHLGHLHYDYFNGEGESGSLKAQPASISRPEKVTYTFNIVPPGLPVTYADSRPESPFKVKACSSAKHIDGGSRNERFDHILSIVVEDCHDIIARARPYGRKIVIDNHGALQSPQHHVSPPGRRPQDRTAV